MTVRIVAIVVAITISTLRAVGARCTIATIVARKKKRRNPASVFWLRRFFRFLQIPPAD
jgi:hypothetical protein